jgi:hypothetical protein
MLCEGEDSYGGGGQRAYLRGPGEAGDTGWRRAAWSRSRATVEGAGGASWQLLAEGEGGSGG